jgi:TonB family protein
MPVHRLVKGLRPGLLAAAALAGCSGPSYVTEHPVENRVPPLQAGVYDVKSVDLRPVPTKEVEPDYPQELGAVLTGKAWVVFTVRPDGKVADASVLTADDVLYGEAAVHAIAKWRFRPALLKGSPVPCRLTLPFIFDSPYGYNPGELPAPPPSGAAPPDFARKNTIDQR